MNKMQENIDEIFEGTNAVFKSIFKSLESHSEKFGYHATVANINILVDEDLLGQIDDDVLELKKLLEDSLRDNIDYLPDRYNFNVKDVIGDDNQILIDYYDH